MEKEVNEAIGKIFSNAIDSILSFRNKEIMDLDEFEKLDKVDKVKHQGLPIFKEMKDEVIQKIINLSNFDRKTPFNHFQMIDTVMEKYDTEIEDIAADLEAGGLTFEKVLFTDPVDSLEDLGIVISDETKSKIDNYLKEAKRERVASLIVMVMDYKYDIGDMFEPEPEPETTLSARDTVRVEDLLIDLNSCDVDSFRKMWLGEHITSQGKKAFIDRLKYNFVTETSIHKDILKLMLCDENLDVRKRAQENLLNSND